MTYIDGVSKEKKKIPAPNAYSYHNKSLLDRPKIKGFYKQSTVKFSFLDTLCDNKSTIPAPNVYKAHKTLTEEIKDKLARNPLPREMT